MYTRNVFIKFLFYFTLFSIAIFDLYFIFQRNLDSGTQIATKEITINQVQEQLIKNLYKNELQKINNSEIYYKNTLIEIKNLTIDSPVLIYRFSLFNCSPCVNFTLDKLKEHFPDFSTNNRIMLIYDDENMRISESMFGKNIYVTKDRYSLGLPMEKINIPFMFILDEDLITKQFFVPEKGMPSLTDEYLSIIKMRYFSNEEKSSDSNKNLNF